MALTNYDILSEFPGWSTNFDLFYRQQTSGRTTNGVTQVVDYGTPLWRASFQSRSMKPNELSYWRGRMSLLEGGINTFRGYDKSRCYPASDPNGVKINAARQNPSLILDFIADFSFVGSTSITTEIYFTGSGGTIYLSGLPAGYVLSTGDYISFRHPVTNDQLLTRLASGGVANSAGTTGALEIRPRLPGGTFIAVLAVLVKAWVPMMLVPGSLAIRSDAKSGIGTVTFDAMEYRNGRL